MNDFDKVLAMRRAQGLPCPQTFGGPGGQRAAMDATSAMRGHVLEAEAWLDKLRPIPAAREMVRLVIAVYHLAAEMGIPWAPVYAAVLEAEAKGRRTPDILTELHLIVAQSEDVPHPLHGIPRKVVAMLADPGASHDYVWSWYRILTLKGDMVFPPEVVGSSGLQEMTETTRANMEDLSLRKVDLADLVFVVDIHGAVTESVRKAVIYAQSKGKEVVFMSDEVKQRKEGIRERVD